jgi:hypothetical protein
MNSRVQQKPKPIRRIYVDPIAIDEVENLIPEDMSSEDRYKVAIYKLGIHAIKKTGSFDVAQKCLVCQKTGHTFEECPVLNNHELLKKLHISFCSMCRRMQRQTDDPEPKSIHNIEVSDEEYSSDSSSDNNDDEEESVHTYYHNESDYEPDFP